MGVANYMCVHVCVHSPHYTFMCYQERDLVLQEMKTSTSDVMKSEIQRRSEEVERLICRRKKQVNEYQSEANSYAERLILLKKEGEYENATKLEHHLYCMDGNFCYKHLSVLPQQNIN